MNDMQAELALDLDTIARLTRPAREARVAHLIADSTRIVEDALAEHTEGRRITGTAILYSGGNDSTVLTHLFRDRANFAAHANTGIGIEATREFVRQTCAAWGLQLLERRAPRVEDWYENLVLTTDRGARGQALGGFPGPAMHFKMFARLKERALEQVRRELVTDPRTERVVYLAGRRRAESKRRRSIPEHERRGSTIWVSPLANWTKLDLNTYRLVAGDVPTNAVSDLIHMSGECLCGAMASPGERDELVYWFPGPFEQITRLERALADRDDIPEHRKRWGWGADPAAKAAETAYLARYKVEPDHKDESEGLFLCQSCDERAA